MKKTLFLVGSTYQLFNAVVLRMTVCSDSECDLLLRSAINWQEDMLDRLQALNVFGRIYRPDFSEIEQTFWTLSDEEKMVLVDDPLQYFGCTPVEPVYDEIFAALDPVAWKLIYRYHVLSGKTPELYAFDEGTRAYTLDLPNSDNKPYYMGEYRHTSYAKAIRAVYLYQPDLYALPKYPYELRSLPSPAENQEVKNALHSIFGVEPLPEETFLYFEDYLFADRHASNDMQLFRQVAEIVGRENIITKTHPRSDVDRYAVEGYKSIGKSSVPWEVQLLDGDIGAKVLISVSSTALFTPFITFNKPIHVVSLKKMYRGQNPFHSDVGFQRFFQLLYQKLNENQIYLHMPSTTAELEEVLRYAAMENQPENGR